MTQTRAVLRCLFKIGFNYSSVVTKVILRELATEESRHFMLNILFYVRFFTSHNLLSPPSFRMTSIQQIAEQLQLDLKKMKADISIDCLGLFCPMPIIKTAKAIKEIDIGQVLEIIADDEGIVEDMPNWCKMTGHEYLGIEQHNDGFKAYVRKKQ